MLSSKISKIIILPAVMFLTMIQTQLISGIECFDSTGKYLCNNQGYQGFLYFSNNSYQIYNVQCIGNVYNECWYGVNSTSNISQYIFCNYTFPHCQLCFNSMACQVCQPGYYTYRYGNYFSQTGCRSCSEVIFGCQLCYDNGQCSQCAQPYVSYMGLCYTQSGNLVGDFDPRASKGIVATDIVLDIFVFLILVVLGYIFFYFFVLKKSLNKVPNNQNHIPNYSVMPQKSVQMKDYHDNREHPLGKNNFKEPFSTRNPQQQQYPVETSIREQMIVDQTQRGIYQNR